MKRLLTRIVALMILVSGFWGCDDLGRTTYSCSDYVILSLNLWLLQRYCICIRYRIANNGLKFRW